MIPKLERILPSRGGSSAAAEGERKGGGLNASSQGGARDLPLSIFLFPGVLRWFLAHSEAKFYYLGSILNVSKNPFTS